MAWTKRQLIESAFEEIGLANYVFDLQPEQLLFSLRRLDSMMATWNNKGVRLPYPITSNPDNSNLDDESGIPDAANEAVVLNLAIRIAPGLGKVVSMDTKVSAKKAYIELLGFSSVPEERQITDLPRGQGNKAWRSTYFRFLPKPTKRDQAFPDEE